ncbi:MAG: hypothetical protein B6I38_03780 [Anaerolineaceae bacterium 4572_5.1]|nr:MAG: hypothetical protein B6I38_03780 [Anaerolineaceae bacterium 4572_5.1]
MEILAKERTLKMDNTDRAKNAETRNNCVENFKQPDCVCNEFGFAGTRQYMDAFVKLGESS